MARNHKTVAKSVRTDINLAKTVGTLPQWAYEVKSHEIEGSGHVSVNVSGCPDEKSDEARAALLVLMDILRTHCDSYDDIHLSDPNNFTEEEFFAAHNGKVFSGGMHGPVNFTTEPLVVKTYVDSVIDGESYYSAANNIEVKLLVHVTNGGAVYLTDNHNMGKANVVIRLDGGPQLTRCKITVTEVESDQ